MSTPRNNEKSLFYGVVINSKKESANPYYELAQLQDTLIKQKEFFVATIIHDKDKDINNYPKTTHLHAYIEFTNLKHTKKQLLELLSTCLHIEQNQISIDPTNSNYLLIQYLTHKNDKDKTQYDFENIKSNNEELLTLRYNQEYISKEQRDAHLFDDIQNSKTMLEFISRQGVQNAKSYRNIFQDVKKEQRLDIEHLWNIDTRLENFVDWLLEHKRVLEETIPNELKNTDRTYQEFIRIFGDFKTRFREYFNFKN